jgi:hypothetical protein
LKAASGNPPARRFAETTTLVVQYNPNHLPESFTGLTLASIPPGRGNLGVNVINRELVEPATLRVILDVLQPIRGRCEGIHKIGDAQDEHNRLTVALHQKPFVVIDGAVNDLAELGSGCDCGYLSGHSG